jgi:uncharacterized phage-associated protein
MNIFEATKFLVFNAEASEDDMTNMRLNKLLYFAHGIHLANYGEPLFEEPVEAWTFGPVFPDIYHRFNKFGRMPIMLEDNSYDRSKFSDLEYASLLDAISVFGIYATSVLVEISHNKGGAWDRIMKLKCGDTIPNSLILEEFKFTSPTAFATLLDTLDVVGFRDERGYSISPLEDKDDEWPEYDM